MIMLMSVQHVKKQRHWRTNDVRIVHDVVCYAVICYAVAAFIDDIFECNYFDLSK